MTEKTGRKKSLPAAIANQINEAIARDALQPGTKLPSETQLAEQFKVSRPTIREAMKTLHARQVVTIRQGDGTYVGKLTDVMEDPLKLSFIEPVTLAEDVFEARLLIEPQVAMLAAERATDEEVAELVEITNKMQTVNYLHPDRHTLDIQFHTLLAQCSHNAVLNQLVPVIYETIQKGYVILLDSQDSHHRAQWMHKEICEAVKCHEGCRARSAAEAHIYSSFNDIKASQEKGKGGA